jgi:ABC-type sugar transport system substrate-binding protein
MATFQIEGPTLRLRLSFVEKLEAVRGDVEVPVTSVRAVRAVLTAWPELRGIRAPGTGIPNVIAVGTRRGGFGKDFAVVHGKGPAVVVELEGTQFARLIVTTPDADGVAATIRNQMPG